MRTTPCLALATLVLALLPRPSLAASEAGIEASIEGGTHAGMAPAAADAAASAPRVASAWALTRDDVSVRQALQRWAGEAGWQLVWDIDRDFPIEAEVTLRGGFLDAIAQAMAVLRDTDYPVQARVQSTARIVRIARYLPEGARQ